MLIGRVNKMSKSRKLTEIEKFYIENNSGKSNEEICKDMDGIGPKTVEKHRKSIGQEQKRDHITTTREKEIEDLAGMPEAGNFISNERGVSIMTQQASEITDARRIVKGNSMSKEEYESSNKDKIHKPNDG